jgi:hypothetical protein
MQIFQIVFDSLDFIRLVMSQASAQKAMLKGKYHDADNDTRCSEDSDIRHREVVVNFFALCSTPPTTLSRFHLSLTFILR